MANPSIFFVLAVVCFVLAQCATRGTGWSWDMADLEYGPCVWFQFVPQCQQSPTCDQRRKPTRSPQPTDLQASPIDFTRVAITNKRPEINNSAALAAALCIQRVFPLVQRVDPITGEELTRERPPENASTTMRLEVDGGGVMVARCRPFDPLFFAIDSCDGLAQSEPRASASSNAEGVDASLEGVFEVMNVYLFNGLLHKWDTSGGENLPDVATDFEVEVHVRRATLAKNSTAKSRAYVSQCFHYTKDRGSPDLILSLSLAPSVTLASVNASILTRLVDAMGFAAEQLRAGSGSVVQLSDEYPLFPITPVRVNGKSEEDRLRAFGAATLNPVLVYTGSEVAAPCTPSVPRLLFTVPFLMPATVTTVFTSASVTAKRLAPLAFSLKSFTKLQEASLFQMSHDALAAAKGGGSKSSHEDDDDKKDDGGEARSFSVAFPVLAALNCLFAFYLMLLVCARLQWIKWPTCLGGLNEPVQFYTVALGLELPTPRPRHSTHRDQRPPETDGIARPVEDGVSSDGGDNCASVGKPSGSVGNNDPKPVLLSSRRAAQEQRREETAVNSLLVPGQPIVTPSTTPNASRRFHRRRSSTKASVSPPAASADWALSDVSDRDENERHNLRVKPMVRRRR